jgi:hypothetical protein
METWDVYLILYIREEACTVQNMLYHSKDMQFYKGKISHKNKDMSYIC